MALAANSRSPCTARQPARQRCHDAARQLVRQQRSAVCPHQQQGHHAAPALQLRPQPRSAHVAQAHAAAFPAPISSSSSSSHADASSNPHALATYSLRLSATPATAAPQQQVVAAPQPPVVGGPPARRWTTQMWFEAMVQTVVKQLDGGAFLLRVRFNPTLSLQLIRLSPQELGAGWAHIQATHLSPATMHSDEAVILVHPVASEAQPCVVQQVAGEACPGCPHEHHSQVHPSVAAAAAADAAARGGGVTAAFMSGSSSSSSSSHAIGGGLAAATELLHGRLGDCCSDDGSDSSSGSGHHHHDHHHDDHDQPDTLTAYYGLVVQCREVTDPLQGCYLLKTVSQSSSSRASASSGGGSSPCHCTHYSLNKVCKGPSLQQQYQDSWLA